MTKKQELIYQAAAQILVWKLNLLGNLIRPEDMSGLQDWAIDRACELYFKTEGAVVKSESHNNGIVE